VTSIAMWGFTSFQSLVKLCAQHSLNGVTSTSDLDLAVVVLYDLYRQVYI